MLGTAVSADDAAALSLDDAASTEQCTEEDIERHNRDVQDLLATLFGVDEESALKRR